MPKLSAIIVLLTLLALAFVVTPAQATANTESFEDDPAFFQPASPWYYTNPGDGGVNYVDQNPDPTQATGQRVYKQGPSQTRARFEFRGTDLCDSVSPATFSFDFRPTFGAESSRQYALINGPSTGNNGVGLNTKNPAVGFTVSTTGGVVTYANSGTIDDNTVTVPGLTLVASTWYTATIVLPANCSGSVGFYFQQHGASSADMRGVANPFANGVTSGLTAFITGGVNTDSYTTHLDNLLMEMGSAGTPATNFCADPTSIDAGGDPRADYGYNYVDSTTTFDRSEPEGWTSVDFDEGFVMRSDDIDANGNNDPASMGKGWTGTVHYAEVWFRLEAGFDAQSTNFRAAFSFDSAIPSQTSVGNARTTGSFQDHVAVRIKEFGDKWRINLEYVTGGVGPTTVGNAYLGMAPNTAATFIFRVNTTTANPHFGIWLHDGTQILNESLNQGNLAAKIDDYLFAQWFVSEGGSTLLGDAFTFLDDNDEGQPYNSTCIFIGPGSSLIGGRGTLPATQAPDLTPEDPDAQAEGGLLTGFGLSEGTQYLFGLAIMGGYLLIARKKLDHDAETSKIVVLVLWVAFVWLGIWEAWSLVAAGVVGVAMFSKAGTRLLGG